MTNMRVSGQPLDKPETPIVLASRQEDGHRNEAYEHDQQTSQEEEEAVSCCGGSSSSPDHNSPSTSSVSSDETSSEAENTIDAKNEYEEKETTIEFSSITSDTNIMASHNTDSTDGPTSQLARNLASNNNNKIEESLGKMVENNDVQSASSLRDKRVKRGSNSDNDEITIDLTGSGDDLSGDDSQNGGFTISWHNFDYVVESKWYKLTKQRKPILNNLSGSFRSGELSAILGPSGAGKSTLMDCLLGKRDRGVTGRTQVSFSSSKMERERRTGRPLRIATIPQEDHLLDTLTVQETFMFASRIKNAHIRYADEGSDGYGTDEKNKNIRNRKPFDHFANVQRVIQQLNLSSCTTLKCGKLSGGQYKRVSIGQELLSRPDLMILDEPTSGLDSVTCYQTISALRQLIDSSAYPMAIVATIHQPDIEVFNLFHKAYVLASGGRAIYEGPTNGIIRTVRLSSELVEARRQLKDSGNLLTAAAGGKSSSSPLDNLLAQLDNQPTMQSINPARLIVEVAAGEYGYEITGAMAELQTKAHQMVLTTSTSASSAAAAGSLSDLESDSGILSTTGYSGGNFANIGAGNGEVQLELKSLISQGSSGMELLKPPKFDYTFNSPEKRKAHLDKLLNASKATNTYNNSLRVYLKHLTLHTRRSWITIVRDPMLFSLQLLLHILVPLLISYSFMNQKGYDACPRVGPLDVIDEAYSSENMLDQLNQEIRGSFENLGYMFFQIYVIIFAAVCVTSLTYPLVMHVLLKEYRNGWYSMSSYFLGRTLADLPVPTANVILAMAISYHLTGQPLSPYNWRFASVAALTVLATLVAQTQGLMFGAMLMNLPQSAVFVAPASTAPLVVVSGFLLRINSLPTPLQILSQLSYFTHLLNGFIISRYGFNRCPCDEQQFSINPEHRIPMQTRGIMDLWVETFGPEYLPLQQQGAAENNGTIALALMANSSNLEPKKIDLIGKLVETVERAKVFGHEINNCSQVKPFAMLDYNLQDLDLITCFAALIIMLFAFRWLTYMVLSWKINSCI